ncbi:MAG: exodeoxyribonuclease V subunit beta [Lentisphaerae bacterium]|nr:exodeoxyribonuclease V subunit beta [Lentisphaerota bacterium]
MIKTREKEILLNGCALIEASAGTGKTYTIQNLYLRMVAGWYDETSGQERFLPAEEILVMTYTIAATEELKERIRKILALGLLYFENRNALSDEELNRLDELLEEPRSLLLPGQTRDDRDLQLRSRIRNALLVFDDAAIYTIHGFCQRLLTQYAFESGILFNAEIRTDADQAVQKLLDDYIRGYCYPETSPLLAALRKTAVFLLASSRERSLTRELMTRPDLRILGGGDSDPVKLELDIEKVLAALKQEYHPGLAGELMFPEAGTADPALLEWQKTAGITETDEKILTVLAALHKHIEEHQDDVPGGRFSELCAELDRLASGYNAAVSMHAAKWIREQFCQMKEQENFLTFDDLLKNVLQAVRDPDKPLLNLVRKQYHAAIVDEFQDTDPEQYEIFKLIFGDGKTGHILFFVGDPKQAIYGFRGGDTATYRVAREFVSSNGSKYTLSQNFRSAEKLLTAVNDLFEKCPRPEQGPESVFADQAVEFQPVSAGKKESGLLDPDGNEDPAPLKMCWLTPSDQNASAAIPMKNAVKAVCRVCAEDIVALLNSSWCSPKTGKPVKPNDIAVLVPDNADAVRMRSELKKRNVPCVIPKSENVFKSAAAKHLKTVLKAVISPADSSQVSAAMLTPLLGFSLDDMVRINASAAGSGSASQLNSVQEKLTALSAVWHQSSFLKMFQEMLRVFTVRATLLKQNDGERILTDLLHLRDLIHQKISQSALSPAGVLSYLAGQETDADSEEKETMMETDREAVVISTVHSSKGLEYPVVMLPLMFKKSFSFESGRIYCYHDANGHLTLNLSPNDEDIQLIEQERKQELMRLLYVALTRAKYSCYLYWGLISAKKNSELQDRTALDWLFPTLSGHDMRNRDEGLPEQLENAEFRLVNIDQLNLTPWRPPDHESEKLLLRKWSGTFDPNYHFTSFSGLAGGHDGSDGLDYDSDDFGNKLEKPVGIFKLPAGAQTGNAWHDIMEEIDFTSFDPDSLPNREFIEKELEIFGVLHNNTKAEIRREYVQLTGEMIRQVLNTPLTTPDGTAFSLKDISRSERLSEMKFNYCFHQKQVQTSQLTRLLSDYVGQVFGVEESEIAIRKMTISGGFLNGALDLLFRHQGKFYIADWKSNRINGRTSGFSESGVTDEMADHTYYLQYLIYTVAVMKYLALHLQHPISETEYEELFGGVYYFFMRGVDPAVPGQGVFFARPPYALIRNLEQLVG